MVFLSPFPSNGGEKMKGGLECLYLLKKSGKHIMTEWHKSMRSGFVKYLKLLYKEDNFDKTKKIFY